MIQLLQQTIPTITHSLFTWASKTTCLKAQANIFDSCFSSIIEIRLFDEDDRLCYDYDGKTIYVGNRPVLVQNGVIILYKSQLDNKDNPVIELEDDRLIQVSNVKQHFVKEA